MKKTMMILMLVAVVGLVAGSASAALYDTGFESPTFTTTGGTGGTSTVDGQDSWTVVAGNAWISTVSPISNSQSLRIEKSSVTGHAERDFSSTAKADVVVEWTVKSMVTNANNASLYLVDSDGDIATIVASSSAGITAWNGTTANVLDANDDDTVATTLKVVTNTTARTYDVYIGGSTTAANANPLNFYGGSSVNVNGLTTVRVKRFTQTDAVFDDITITPEPATMTLLLLGLPFAIRRRR